MHKMEQNEVLEYFDFLQSLADAAAKITLSHFRQKVHVENKNSPIIVCLGYLFNISSRITSSAF